MHFLVIDALTHLRLNLVFLLLSVLMLCSPLFGQSDRASMSGRITDQSGAVLIGVKVDAIDVATGSAASTFTNSEGIYSFSDLRPAIYRIVIKQKGFRTIVLSDCAVNVQDVLSRNFTMQIGAVTESLVVTDNEQGHLSSAVSTVVDQQFVQNMPLNGRSFQSLISLTPGSVVTVPSVTQAGEGLGQLSINGQRANANYFMVDGMSWNFNIVGQGQSIGGTIPAFTVQGTTNGVVPVDAMQEFRVVTSTFAPELGRTPGAQISIVTRSGTNNWHGTVFDYLRNDAFDARNYFDAPPLPKPPLRQNDFGGTLSGPISKDRLFFFFSYEGLRLRLPETTTGNFYTASARANVAPAYQPLLAALPIPTGPANSDGITAPLTVAYSDPTSFNSVGLRVDYKLNNRMTLFGRYSYAPSIESSHYFSTLSSTNLNVNSLTAGFTTSFGPDKLNDLRFNWSRAVSMNWYQMVPFYGAVPPPASALYPLGYNNSNYRLTLFPGDQDGEVSSGQGQGTDKQRQVEVADTFSVSRGAHQLKFGGDFRQMTPSVGAALSALVLSSYQQVQTGIAGTVVMFGQNAVRARLYNYSFFGQDFWRATPRLTLTYGLRWEINTPLGSITPGKPLYNINGIFNSEPFGLVPVSTLGHTDYNNFAPRIGASFQVTPLTVLRGGFGLFYDLGFGGGIPGDIQYFPYQSISSNQAPVPFNFGNPAFAPPPFTTVPTLNNAANLFAVDPNLRLPLVYEWNVAVEQALTRNQSLSFTYVGSHGVDLLREDFISEDGLYVDATRNADWSNYNALQVQFRRQMSNGLQALTSYTWAKSLDTGSSDVHGGTFSNSVQNIDVGSNYAPSDFDVRHSFAGAISYEIPSPKTNRLARALLTEWAVYGVVRISSAPPFNLIAIGNSPVFGFYLTRPDIVPGVPFYLSDPSNPGGRILNIAAFTKPPPGAQGDLSRNYFRGFGIDQTDLALSRRFGLTDRFSLYFRAEYFNAFNHPMFADPSADFHNRINLPNFGKVTSTLNNNLTGGPGTLSQLYQIGGPRSGQLTLRLEF